MILESPDQLFFFSKNTCISYFAYQASVEMGANFKKSYAKAVNEIYTPARSWFSFFLDETSGLPWWLR